MNPLKEWFEKFCFELPYILEWWNYSTSLVELSLAFGTPACQKQVSGMITSKFRRFNYLIMEIKHHLITNPAASYYKI